MCNNYYVIIHNSGLAKNEFQWLQNLSRKLILFVYLIGLKKVTFGQAIYWNSSKKIGFKSFNKFTQEWC